MTRAKWGPGGESWTSGRRQGEAGASAVEFALVVPFLLMLVFGVIEFGTVMAQKATVSSAAREGARYGSVNLYAEAMGAPRDCADVVARARENAVNIGMSPSQLAVTITRGSDPTSASPVCSAAANVSTPSGPGAALPPCEGAANNDVLYVKTSFRARLEIPLAVSRTLALNTTGASRCEYN